MPTVDELRDEIRLTAGRFERGESTDFTEESLAAICEAPGADVDTDSLPPTSVLRAAILRNAAAFDGPDGDDLPRSFRKAELEAVADAVGEE